MQPIGPDLDERWSQLVDGALDDGARHQLLAIAAGELNQVLAERNGDYRGLLDAVGSVAEQPVTEQLWEDATRAFELALGGHASRLVNWLVLDSQYAPRLAEIKSQLDPPAAAFLTDLLVRFGDRLERSSYLFVTRSEHDWRLINREINVDRATGRMSVRLKISKYNGEIVLIEGRPDSILTLADAVLASVLGIGDRSAFLQDVGPFLETMQQTAAMLTGDPTGSDADQQDPAMVGAATVLPTADGASTAVPTQPTPSPYR